jgi:hypothetical protein
MVIQPCPDLGLQSSFIIDSWATRLKRGQFVETPWLFIKTAPTVDPLLHTGSDVTRCSSLTKSVVCEAFDTTSAPEMFEYQVVICCVCQ